MNELIARKSLDTYTFAEYVSKAEVLEAIYSRAGELEDTIEAMDEDIEAAERIGAKEAVETLCKSRNRLNMERLDLTMYAHKLEIELSEFEKVRMLTR